ncbi:hypothetical protein B0H66DRAFT_544991 [Apodospora peruviana]|uniref:Uncharacterized protein n=1 Tax=Apodospora peruviana TaxID=516989 RepID=A0AAE0IT83_9PEZI|nr:hypothetical protein B0H66DRAFT_544991 [Apodospora peruviana]
MVPSLRILGLPFAVQTTKSLLIHNALGPTRSTSAAATSVRNHRPRSSCEPWGCWVGPPATVLPVFWGNPYRQHMFVAWKKEFPLFA